MDFQLQVDLAIEIISPWTSICVRRFYNTTMQLQNLLKFGIKKFKFIYYYDSQKYTFLVIIRSFFPLIGCVLNLGQSQLCFALKFIKREIY